MSNSFFGVDFYPTTKEVIERMLATTHVAGKIVLEPSAGSGNIVDYVKQAGAKDVIACELDNNLRKVLSGKCHVIDTDFLNVTADKISHVDFIIMNPPFSKQEEHILHAWDIAPSGCQIISLCNSTMVKNQYTRIRTQISEIIKQNGRFELFGECFSNADRRTDVDVACIHMYKPATGEDEFTGYFDLHDYEQDEINGSGIIRYDFVQDVVSRYVEAVQMFDEVDSANKRISNAIAGVSPRFSISFGATVSRNESFQTITREVFKKELQKSAWTHLFSLFNMHKYITKGVLADINKFVEQQVHVPFTVRNVYLMIQLIAGTHSQRMDKVLCEAFDTICQFSAENSTAGEGWRTNTDFLINKKFIMPHVCEYDKWNDGYVQMHYRQRCDDINDIVKALCHLSGQPYDESYDSQLRPFFKINKVIWGEWIDWKFFRVKGFKKGTLHLEFLDEDLWRKFNQRVAEIRGWNNVIVHSKKARQKK